MLKTTDLDKTDELEGFVLTAHLLNGSSISSSSKNNINILDLRGH